MELNFDVVRSCLLDIESDTSLDNCLVFNKTHTAPGKFYTLLKLEEANLIECKVIRAWGGPIKIIVLGLTWNGHQFLDNIRSPKAVEYTKATLQELGSASIQIMSQIAAAFVKKSLGL